ncbi:unnamed protein product [Staurois parvus]|uniref:Uncharacterized protein n=1 Tax=Staurois parvus TaxID=386267 RepID=A0ABN9ARH4_9NEOB|nr:unnamed protein product [Staurois parvus]
MDCRHSTGDDQRLRTTVQEMTRDCGHSTGMTRDCGHSTGMTRDCGHSTGDDQRLRTQYRR